jgi:acyl carrier protein
MIIKANSTHYINIEEEIKNIISDVSRCRKSRIRLDSQIVNNLGIDSFTALEILVAVESKFSIKIPGNNISKLSTVDDLVSFVKNKIQ